MNGGDHEFRGGSPVHSRRWRWIVWCVFLLGAALAWLFAERYFGGVHDPDAVPRVVTPRGDLAAEEKSNIELFRLSSPSVVYITRLAMRRDRFSLNMFEIPQGTGSGFVWNNLGHIITNFHVVQGRVPCASPWRITPSGMRAWWGYRRIRIWRSCSSMRREPA